MFCAGGRGKGGFCPGAFVLGASVQGAFVGEGSVRGAYVRSPRHEPIKLRRCGFNQYFSTVGENIVNKLVSNNTYVNSNDFKSYCSAPINNSIFVEPTDSNELMTIIHKLHNSKCSDHDNIRPKLIKYAALAIINPLVHI